jgi:CHASE3 domain sensor protein
MAGRSLAAARRLVAAGEGKRRVDDIRKQFAAIRTGLRVDAAREERDARAAVRRAVAMGLGGLLLSALLYTLYSV